MSEPFDNDLTMEAIEAHAESMTQQPWWALYVAEQALGPCPTCNESLELLLDGEDALNDGDV